MLPTAVKKIESYMSYLSYFCMYVSFFTFKGLIEIEIEQGLTSHQKQYRSYQGRFYRSYDQSNSVKALKETSWSFR